MAEKARVVVASAMLPLAAGTTLQWDGSSSIFQDVGPTLVPAPVREVWQAKRERIERLSRTLNFETIVRRTL